MRSLDIAATGVLAQQRNVEVVSNIHDVHGAGPPRAERDGLLFVGSYRHPPNLDAARWLVEEILPRVRARLPDVELHLVGGDAPPEVEAYGERDGVRFHGYVPDLLPLLRGARIGVAPLRYGAGVKGKVAVIEHIIFGGDRMVIAVYKRVLLGRACDKKSHSAKQEKIFTSTGFQCKRFFILNFQNGFLLLRSGKNTFLFLFNAKNGMQKIPRCAGE